MALVSNEYSGPYTPSAFWSCYNLCLKAYEENYRKFNRWNMTKQCKGAVHMCQVKSPL
jgi:hypothetical protein